MDNKSEVCNLCFEAVQLIENFMLTSTNKLSYCNSCKIVVEGDTSWLSEEQLSEAKETLKQEST